MRMILLRTRPIIDEISVDGSYAASSGYEIRMALRQKERNSRQIDNDIGTNIT